MVKNIHEIRDPIHVFVRLDSQEREVLDSRPFQRLRHIHQLGMTYLLYPGATHKRFEHSLGVLELATRVFNIVTNESNIDDKVRHDLPDISIEDKRTYWRKVMRMAALCHDIGHLPFSHAAEDLLPDGWTHEDITREIILSDEMREIWQSGVPPLKPEHIAKIAIGPKKYRGVTFSKLETLLSEIIVGDAFGVDRMDYLLRDSHHTGVAYGKFDHYRLIDTLRILPHFPADETDVQSSDLTLGVEQGGIHSSEALLLARYFMFSQMYLHPVRRIYDIHLKDFLKLWLPNNKYDHDLNHHLKLTDNEVNSAISECSFNRSHPACESAKRLVERNHYRVLYERNPKDVTINRDAAFLVYDQAKREFGKDLVRYDRYSQKGGSLDFPVKSRDGGIVSSTAISKTLAEIPVVAVSYVFIERSKMEAAKQWLSRNKQDIIKPAMEE